MDLQKMFDDKQQKSAEYAEKKQTERDSVIQSLDEGIEEVTSDPQLYTEFLKKQGEIPGYSAGNVILLMQQKPEATHVGSFDYWKKRGRNVNKGESGLIIMAPERYNYPKKEQRVDLDTGELLENTVRKRGLGFKITKVFDVSQTSGKALPPPPQLTEESELLRRAVQALVNMSPVPLGIREDMAQPAMYDAANLEIAVRPGMSASETFFALAKEVTHAQLHRSSRQNDYDYTGYDFYASSAATMLCSRFGVDGPMPDFSGLHQEFSVMEHPDKKLALNTLHDLAKSTGDRIHDEVGLPKFAQPEMGKFDKAAAR